MACEISLFQHGIENLPMLEPDSAFHVPGSAVISHPQADQSEGFDEPDQTRPCKHSLSAHTNNSQNFHSTHLANYYTRLVLHNSLLNLQLRLPVRRRWVLDVVKEVRLCLVDENGSGRGKENEERRRTGDEEGL